MKDEILASLISQAYTDHLIQKCDEVLRMNTPEKHRKPFYDLFKRMRTLEKMTYLPDTNPDPQQPYDPIAKSEELLKQFIGEERYEQNGSIVNMQLRSAMIDFARYYTKPLIEKLKSISNENSNEQ